MKKIHTNYIKAIIILSILLYANSTVSSISNHQMIPSRRFIDTTEGINDEKTAFEAFDQKISFLMNIAGFPSLAACIIKEDQVIWSKGYGYYDSLEEKPATTDTIYLLASITKTIVGTALMQLYEQDYFDLDDDVNLFLPFSLRNPHFPDDPITFRMLLSHTSSLNVNTQMNYYWFNFSDDPPFDFFPDPYLQEFLLPKGRYYDNTIWGDTFRPGDIAMYANVGFDVISYLVEIISDESFLSFCDKNIFKPLNMQNTSFNLTTLPQDAVAIPYQRFMGRYRLINELDFMFDENTPPDRYWRPRFYPAGGLYSTVSDLSHFLIAHMNKGVYQDKRILKEETVEMMHKMQPGNNIGYGLAWMHTAIAPDITVSGHGGDIHGVDTWMLYDDTEQIGVIYLANGNPAYGCLPFNGLFLFRLILYSLFTKSTSINKLIRSDTDGTSDLFFRNSLMTPALFAK